MNRAGFRRPATGPVPPGRPRARARAACLVLLLVGCSLAGPRTVLPGRLYLAGQPGPGECEQWIGRLGLRSMVNLRGAGPGRASYRAEKACLERAGVALLDLPFLASEDPPPHLLRRFLRKFPDLPEPVLIHCRSGVDRTALGVFLALMLRDRPFMEAASWVRDLRKHPCLRACPQKRFVNGFEAWCAGKGRLPGRGSLTDYIQAAYCPGPYRFDLVLKGLPERVDASAPVRIAARVTNAGPSPWRLSAGSDRGTRLGVRLFGPLDGPPGDLEDYFYEHRPSGRDVCRAGLEEGLVRSGERRGWTLDFSAPAEPGLYLMAVDMVEEHRAWFSDFGLAPHLSLLKVEFPPAPRP